MTHPVIAARRRLILARGASATLRRQTAVTPAPAYASVMLTAALHGFKPGALTAAHREGDQQAEILPDEIDAADWPGPPQPGDTLVTTAGTLVVQSAAPVWVAGDFGGWRLWVRGP